jgi:GPH family glycoside/pentoside/hexuronide:cation symporter
MAYGCGDTACNIVFGMITTLLTLFYTDYVGINPITIGLVMLVSRVFDGTSDVIMGFFVEKTHSKYGKARPWILWMSVPYAIAAVLLFAVPHTTEFLQGIYIFVTYNLCTTVFYTAINVPYGSLSTLMTNSSHEQDLLSIFRMGLAPMGRIIAVTFTMPVVKLFGNTQVAWIKAMGIWASIALVLLLICFFNCKEKVQPTAPSTKKVPIGKNLKALAKNQYFWVGLVLWTITCVHSTIVGTVLPYYCKYIFHNDSWMYSLLYLLETGILCSGAFVCPLFLHRFTKRTISLVGAVVAVAGQALVIINPNSFVWVAGTSVIRAIGEVPLTALIFGILGDVVDFGEWKTGFRQEGLVFGGGSMGFKLGTGITSAIVTAMMSYAGYIASVGVRIQQPIRALKTIQNIYIWGPLIIWIFAVIVLIFYKLDEIYPQIIHELVQRKKTFE